MTWNVEWFDVREKLPEKDGEYLVVIGSDWVTTAEFNAGWRWSRNNQAEPVTHWQEKPEPPANVAPKRYEPQRPCNQTAAGVTEASTTYKEQFLRARGWELVNGKWCARYSYSLSLDAAYAKETEGDLDIPRLIGRVTQLERRVDALEGR